MHDVIKTSWLEISNQVKSLNKSLFDVIDADPKLKSHELTIYKYQYGDTVGDESYFYGPSSSDIKKQIIPFCMVLNNSFEMPITINKNTIPWKIYKPGNIFPYARFLESNKRYEPTGALSMVAGAKSSFLLINKISDKKWHRLLCNKYKIDIPPPKCFSEHFDVFKALSNSCETSWRANLLVFPESFFEQAEKNHDFKEMIYKTSLNEKLFKSNIYAYDALLDIIFRDSNITSDFVGKCIRNILYIGCGDRPTKLPTSDELYGPINFITEAYIDGFKSKSCPILMISDFLAPFESKKRAYFSLNNLDYLIKPEKISSQAKIISAVNKGYSTIADKIITSGFSPESIFSKSARTLLLNEIRKNDSNYYDTIIDDNNLHDICTRYNLPIPQNSTFLSSCIAMHYKS